ncbi:hypothetical protein [Umezawaea sp. Da 62-37]|uniref:hypothetical protein n=1 Tax=Umezawaea sp. Da 62-37 TaxID=3075927 RepID=UPI0028F7272A|nr:hypothetical protein [Umezawaea sp. Da 62-37]WNV90657.1 hypothetical protein RM788_20950 [Umezawaea sp. Da 62-37]
MGFGTLGVVKRWQLVTAHPRPTGSRLAVVALLTAVIAGALLVGRVLAADPIGYGVPIWPFANSADQAEDRVMQSVVKAARADAASLGNLTGIPSAIAAGDVEVIATKTQPNGMAIWLLLRLHVPSVGTRCREAVVLGATPVEVNSRTVTCTT